MVLQAQFLLREVNVLDGAGHQRLLLGFQGIEIFPQNVAPAGERA